jgi:glucose/arabinose dehydrogenase
MTVRAALETSIISFALVLSLAWAGGAVAQAGDVPGESVHIRFEDLPPPAPGAGARNPPAVVNRAEGEGLAVPPGFSANLFAEGLAHPRAMTIAPNGDVFLAESREGRITILRDEDGDGGADLIQTFASGYQRPFGLAFHDGALYVADLQAVWRVPYEEGALSGRGRTPVTTLGALGNASGHWTRNLVFSPDGDYFFVSIGSRNNLAEEPEPRATIQRFRADGTDQITFAGGLRNPVGLAFYPGTDDLYTVVNERDGYGDAMVPDYFTRVAEDDFFGWPYAYLGPHPDPDWGDVRPDLVELTRAPDVLFEAHSAPIGLVFYEGDQFPAPYRGGAFVAHRGSWNAGEARGYRVVFIPFTDGRPDGSYEIFATGFRRGGETTAEVWGRPAGLAIARDGGLLIADDTGGTIWRVTYTGE